MINYNISLIFSMFLILNIEPINIEESYSEFTATYFPSNIYQEDGLRLLKENCYSCHSVKSKSFDKIKAPPMELVKNRYKLEYKSEKEFIKAFSSWTLKPAKEKALLLDEIERFKLMPKLRFYEEDILIIAKYIYNNELEKPSWFESFYNNQ